MMSSIEIRGLIAYGAVDQLRPWELRSVERDGKEREGFSTRCSGG
jgi:hypothetical protein